MLFRSISGNQLKLFYFDAIFKEFERVLQLVLRRSSLDFIRRYYETEYVYDMDDGNSLHRITIKSSRRKNNNLPSQHSDLPKVLYLRESLLNNTRADSEGSDESQLSF